MIYFNSGTTTSNVGQIRLGVFRVIEEDIIAFNVKERVLLFTRKGLDLSQKN